MIDKVKIRMPNIYLWDYLGMNTKIAVNDIQKNNPFLLRKLLSYYSTPDPIPLTIGRNVDYRAIFWPHPPFE